MTYLSAMKKCAICNKEFEAKRSDAKICSPQCRQKANRAGIKFRGEKISAVPAKEKVPVKPVDSIKKKGAKDRKTIHSTEEKTKIILEPDEGTNAFFLRYGAFYKKDITK